MLLSVSNLEGGIRVLTLSGELDLANVDALKNALHNVEGVRALLIDLSGVEYMDSTTLGVLVSCRKRMEEMEHRVYLVAPGPNILKVLSITGLGKVFRVFQTLEQAQRHAKKAA